MKFLTRPFVLRLAVALLTFKLGVLAAIMLGHFNPLGGHHARPSRVRRCGGEHRQWWTPPSAPLAPDAPVPPSVIYPIYRPEIKLGKTARHSQPPVQPVPPSFEDEGETKSAGAAPTHQSP